MGLKFWSTKCETMELKFWSTNCETMGLKFWSTKCETIALKSWSTKCETIALKSWSTKCETMALKSWSTNCETMGLEFVKHKMWNHTWSTNSNTFEAQNNSTKIFFKSQKKYVYIMKHRCETHLKHESKNIIIKHIYKYRNRDHKIETSYMQKNCTKVY